jgi:hypothetical protein
MAAVVSHTIRAVATCEASRSTHSQRNSVAPRAKRLSAHISQFTAFSAKFTPRQSRYAGRSAVRSACAATVSIDTLAACKVGFLNSRTLEEGQDYLVVTICSPKIKALCTGPVKRSRTRSVNARDSLVDGRDDVTKNNITILELRFRFVQTTCL